MKKWKNVLYAAIASMFAMTAIVVDLSALPKETTSLKAYLSHCLFTDSLVDAGRRAFTARCAHWRWREFISFRGCF